jgi:hypothetical protein
MRRGRGLWRPSLNETGYFHLYVAPKIRMYHNDAIAAALRTPLPVGGGVALPRIHSLVSLPERATIIA